MTDIKIVRCLFLTVLITLASVNCWGQETTRHQTLTVGNNSRYEIVQSELGVRYTFNIDKYSGNVFLLVEGKDGLAWQLIEAEEQAYNETKENQINYQLFTSGLGVRYTFLLNVNTGITWQLTEDTATKEMFWAKFG